MKNNKLKTFLFLLIALFVVAFPVKAEELLTTTKEEVVNEAYYYADDDFETTKTVNGSAFLAGNNVTASGRVDGILFAAGNNVVSKGRASYAALAGNMIEVLGTYEKDVAIAGNIIKVRNEAQFGRDVAIFGNEVTISGVVTRNIIISAERVYFENATILGSAQIYATKVSFSENSKIEGNAKSNLDIDAKYVGGTFTKVDSPEINTNINISYKTIILGKIISVLSLLLTFVALYLLFPKMFKVVSETKFEFMQVLSLCGTGLIFLVFLPFAAILLLITAIGIPLSILSLVFYFVSIYLAEIFTGYYLGGYIWKSLLNKEDNPLVYTLIGVLVIFLLSLIPVVKVFTTILSLLIGLGLIIRSILKQEKK